MKSIELFAGIGGLGMGIFRAGFRHIIAIEKDKECCSTLHNNQLLGHKDLKGWRIENLDIKDFDFKSFEDKIDLISGGPPCQPFSFGGKGLGNLDDRNSFPLVIKAIKDIRPKAFILENVRGLTRKQFSNYFEYIRLQLSFPDLHKRTNESWINHLRRLEKVSIKGNNFGLHYNVLYKVLNAADYGLPQRRERVFIVGFISEKQLNWQFPIATHSQLALLWSQCKGDYWDIHKIPIRERIVSNRNLAKIEKLINKPCELPWVTLRDAISNLPDPLDSTNKMQSLYSNHIFHPGAKTYYGHTGSLLDEPAKTLKAGSHGVPGGENAIRMVNGSVRYFTIRESARLQGFPDDFVFDCSWGQAIKQLGNAVPISLAEILAKSIKKSLYQK